MPKKPVLWSMSIIFLATSESIFNVKGDEVVGDLFLKIDFMNYDGKFSAGRSCDFWLHDLKCDVYIKVCVSSEKGGCDLLKETTQVAWNTAELSRNFVGVILSESERFSLRIEVWDYDVDTKHDLIGTFENHQIYFRDISFVSAPVNVTRSDIPQKNFLRLDAFLRKKCRENYYGGSCQIFCKSNFTNNYCDEYGRDQCSPGSTCDKVSKKNLECHCKNNGTCIMIMGSYFCNCTRKWRGPLCEIEAPDVPENSLYYTILLPICILIVVVALGVAINYCIKHSKWQNFPLPSPMQLTPTFLQTHSPQTTPLPEYGFYVYPSNV